MKRSMSVLLSVCLLVASLGLTACNEDEVRLLKEKGNNLIVYSNWGIQGLQELKASVQLEGEWAGYEKEAEDWLGEIRDTTAQILEQTKDIKKIDKNNRKDLAATFAAVMKTLDKLKPKVKEIVEKAIAYLNEKGIINVQSTNEITRRIDFAISFLTGSAKLIENKLAP